MSAKPKKRAKIDVAAGVCNVLVRRVAATDYRAVIDLFKVSLMKYLCKICWPFRNITCIFTEL